MDDLIAQFEECTLPQSQWHHKEHVLVGLHYVTHHSERAEELMCAGIQRLNAAHGVPQTTGGGYHETLTIAWIRYLRLRVRAGASPEVLLEECLADPRLLLRYYSREVINSWEARTGWVPPDLEPLEGDASQARRTAP